VRASCSASFEITLNMCGMSYDYWLLLFQTKHMVKRQRKTIEKLIKKVQRVHTGKGFYIAGVYVMKGEKV